VSATPFVRGGQRGWAHDEGHPAGVFHTYDAFDLPPAVDADPRRLRGPRKVHVLLPRVAPPPGGFPLVLMHDGDTVFWPGGIAGGNWDVAGTLSRLAGRVAPAVVVAIHPRERDHEYTHVDWAWGSRPFGGVAAYAAWLAGAVKPWVAANYPVSEGPAVIAGASHGGLASFWCATRHPEAFGVGGCFSPSLFSGLRPGDALADAPLLAPVADLLADRARRPTLWVCWGLRRDRGDHDRVVEHLATVRGRELVGLLVGRFGYALGRDLFAVEDPEAGHDEGAWRVRFGSFIAEILPSGGRAERAK
jgi:hypothetical protein